MSVSPYQRFKQEGYLVYPQLYEGGQLALIREACLHVLERYTAEHDSQRPEEDFHVIRHLNDPKWFAGREDLFRALLDTVADPRCLGPVEHIFRGPSLFRCTSLFVAPRKISKDGDWHRDSQFAHAEEEEKRILRDIRDSDLVDGLQMQIPLYDNADIEYVPYSANRYDSPEEYYIRLADGWSHNREEGMPNAIRMHLQAGDGLIFNPYGLHRGRYHTDKPRLTLMLTYTPESCTFRDTFSNQPWCLNEGYLDGVSARARAYFQEFIRTYRDFWTESPATP
ncbi:phytanoyl-CoA dioxygenase family protein [Paenibacillus cymbidii]|uniref:phytanoyl-CoA dioxygenase family protein n=1 Tax=Paenibacillus cymbidii TaxID=1639034 RepID=UPI0010819984|nr:phytanoyl-CoA dioxygenase family protein [Paenibacillus cymbidii]